MLLQLYSYWPSGSSPDVEWRVSGEFGDSFIYSVAQSRAVSIKLAKWSKEVTDIT